MDLLACQLVCWKSDSCVCSAVLNKPPVGLSNQHLRYNPRFVDCNHFFPKTDQIYQLSFFLKFDMFRRINFFFKDPIWYSSRAEFIHPNCPLACSSSLLDLSIFSCTCRFLVWDMTAFTCRANCLWPVCNRIVWLNRGLWYQSVYVWGPLAVQNTRVFPSR